MATCDIATPKQMSMAEKLRLVERNEIVSWEDRNTQPLRTMSDPLHKISSSVAQPIAGKTPSPSIFRGNCQNGRGFI